MLNHYEVAVRVARAPEDDDAAAAATLQLLRAELLRLDVDGVGVRRTAAEPDPAVKGLGTALGSLWVKFGNPTLLKDVVAALSAWARRSRRSVEIQLGEDRLVVSGATAEQQERLIQAFLSAHASGG